MKTWLLLLLLVALLAAFAVQEWRHQAAVEASNAAREAQFRATVQAIEAQRAEQERTLGALQAERVRLKADLAQHASRVAALERERQAAGEAVTRAGEAAARLAIGPLDDIVRAGEGLGLAPRVAPRPRP